MKNHTKRLVSVSVLGLILFFNSYTNGYAQSDQEDSEEEDLEWIDMMEDPDVNYFEAIKSYSSWKKENEEEGEKEESEENEERPVEQKRFVAWMNEMYPFVQSDGSILPEKQRRKILRKIKH